MDTHFARRGVAALGLGLTALLLLIGQRMGSQADAIDNFRQSKAQGLTTFDGPIVAIELPETPEDVVRVIGAPSAAAADRDRGSMRTIVHLDNRFIPVYATLLLTIVWLASRGRSGYAPRAVAVLSAIAVVIAAGFDYAENAAILGVVDASSLDQAAVDAVRHASQVKWTAFFLAVFWIGILLMTRRYRREVPRVLVAGTGLLDVFGALCGLGFWIVPGVVTAGSGVLFASLFVFLVVALLYPQKLDDPDQANASDLPVPRMGKPDHLLPLALDALQEVKAQPESPLARRFEQEVERHKARVSTTDVPLEVRLELMADLLVRERPEDARRLASAQPQASVPPQSSEFARSLSEDVMTELATNAHGCRERLLETLAAHLGPAAVPVGQSAQAPSAQSLCGDLLVRPSLAVRVAEHLGRAVPFALAQQAELDEVRISRAARLHGGAPSPDKGGPPSAGVEADRCDQLDAVAAEKPPQHRYAPRLALDLGLTGLAFSGGGIRSATFNLGVLQALADLRLLQYFDYLSTVSGGGYIGTWFASWVKRNPGGVNTVQELLSPTRCPDPSHPSHRPIRFLREYSSYLTPRRGLLGADTWTSFATWVRNTLLNQGVLVLFLAALLLVPRGFSVLAATAAGWQPQWIWVTAAAGLTLYFILGLRIATELSRFVKRDALRTGTDKTTDWAPAASAGPGIVQSTIVAPGFAFALFLALPIWYWARLGWRVPARLAGLEADGRLWAAVLAAVLVAFGILVIEFRAGYARSFFQPGSGHRQALNGVVVVSVATVVPALFAGLLALGLVHLVDAWVDPRRIGTAAGSAHLITLGPPLLIMLMGLSLILHIGLVGRDLDDDRREWWSRFGAWRLIWSAGWIAVFGLALYGPFAVLCLEQRLAAAGGLTWLVSTAWGAYIGRGATRAPAPARDEKPAVDWKGLAAAVTPYVFVLGLLVIVALGLHLLLVALGPGAAHLASWQTLKAEYWSDLNGSGGAWTARLFALFLAASLLLAWRVDVNEFSMHHYYRNRLVRCFLGASRDATEHPRRSHPFTGFDRGDDAFLATFRTDPRLACHTRKDPDAADLASYVGPLPVICTSLNLVKGEDLAWQERKAQSFVFTPLFSGYEYAAVGGQPASSPSLATDGLRPTCAYAYPNGGVQCGTAIAISGAAANPNMGYHSSPATAFLMTMFDVRLGWWMGNPRHRVTWRHSSPTFGLSSLLSELASYTTNRSRFVNLSDGGHFENLGLYELVRRRCRYVVVCDAEQDGDLTFNGLGNAVRKCRTDFGVDIRIRTDAIVDRDARTRHSRAHVALGDILYPGGEKGWLLYLKSSLTGDEPADVLEYAARTKPFPHETTADQFFDESQFESYRQLGYHVACQALDDAVGAVGAEVPKDGYVQALFGALAAKERAPRHAPPTPPLPASPGPIERRSGLDRREAMLPVLHDRRSGQDRRGCGRAATVPPSVPSTAEAAQQLDPGRPA
jgi:hypothetical protein